jgi:phosphoglycolate phosphatase
MHQPAIIFDLDGTLVDTAPDLINTLNHILQEEGLPTVSSDIVRPMISQGAKAMLKKGVEIADAQRSEDELTALTDRFVNHYSDHIAVDSQPFPGLLPVLDRLSAQPVKLGICTNKRETLSKKLLGELSLDHYFQAIIGVDTLPVRKPDPGHLLGTLEAVGGSPKQAVMIGDSETDILTAKAAGIPVIALDFGYSTEPVHTYLPDAIVSHYDDLVETLNTLLPGQTF